MGAGLVCTAGAQVAMPLRPVGFAYDAAGDLFFADAGRSQVYEASVGGVLTVIAGTGVQGFAGDGGPAPAAELNRPQAVAVGADGTVYVVDTGNERVRAIAVNGVISTVVGSGLRGFAGDGGAGTAAELNEPQGIAVNAAGDLLIADTGNDRVRALHAGLVSTFAGTGVQGLAGDGGAAAAAELDGPVGISVAADGRVFVADTRNHRVRVIAEDGTIATFAGTGIRGFEGDGGAATLAELALPRGVVAMPDGSVLIADEDNRRIRSVSAGGVISTLVGNGVQASAVAEGTAGLGGSLNDAKVVGVSALGQAVFADTAVQLVRGMLGNGGVYSAAGLVPARASAVSFVAPESVVYGAGSAAVSVKGTAATPLGVVELMDGAAGVGSAALQGGAASFGLGMLGVGTHALSVRYAGDGFNPAAVSGVSSVMVTAASVVASADAATVAYGQGVGVLSGTWAGVLPQDETTVKVGFSSVAGVLSEPGVYPIAAAMTGAGSGNYVVSMAAGSGELTVVQATTTVSLSAAAGYAGLPMTMTARVTPQFAGVPTGTVSFADGGTVVATGTVSDGVAAGVYLAPGAGTHSLTATYSGDVDFAGAASSSAVTSVGAMPDFSLAVSGAGSQTVPVGNVAAYAMTLGASPGPFSGAVSFSASGLPAGTAVSFSPPSAVPGTGGTTVTMSVPTASLLSSREGSGGVWWAMMPLGLVLVWRRRRWVLMGGLVLLSGCGARTVPDLAQVSKSYTIVVTGTGTSLAGTVLVHSVNVSLTVE